VDGIATPHDARSGSIPSNQALASDTWLDGWPGWRTLLAVLVLNVISAILFIKFVNRPVYDDQFNISDVHMYATQGVSVASIRSNKNPPGPTSFAWMAATVHFLGGDELRDARIGALLSWILLGAGVLIGARYTRYAQLWHVAFLAALLFPHSVESAALVLTEGPALFFGLFGALMWVEFVSRPNVSAWTFVLGTLGGLSMGLAVTCRQYYLALLPAAFFLALWQARRRIWKENWRWYLCLVASLAAAAVPVLVLIFIWKGLSSPGIATGASYHNWRADVGLALGRPLIAGIYTSVYFLPLAIPAAFQLKFSMQMRELVAVCGGVVAGYFHNSVLQPGPLNTMIHFVARGKSTQAIAVGALAAVAIYSASAAVVLLWKNRQTVLQTPPILFAILLIGFFVAEQMGVGGNIPFYDRYVLQIAPFLGMIGFAMFPRLSGARLGALGGLLIISQVMLWRFAWG
jgi:hypothetical protein